MNNIINQKIKTYNTNNVIGKNNYLSPYKKDQLLNINEIMLNYTNLQTSKRIIRHFPPATKEWKNSFFAYNKNNYYKLLPAISTDLYNFLNTYLNLDARPSLLMRPLKKQALKSRFSMKKLFISKPETKHNNNKVIITVYSYNRKKNYLLKKISRIVRILKTKYISQDLESYGRGVSNLRKKKNGFEKKK